MLFVITLVAVGLFIFAIVPLQKVINLLVSTGYPEQLNAFGGVIVAVTIAIILVSYTLLMATRATFAHAAGAAKMSSPKALMNACEKLAHVPHDDIHEIASLLSQMIVRYYEDVRQQAQRRFFSALGAAVGGLIVFIYAASNGMSEADPKVYVSVIAGGLIEVISGSNFYLYFRTARQFAAFPTCLERINRFLRANALGEHWNLPEQDEMRTELIRAIANVPLLTLSSLEKGA
jgi:hypothetical protein